MAAVVVALVGLFPVYRIVDILSSLLGTIILLEIL
jgi:hypothetical protein